MSTTAALNLLLFLIFVALFAAVFAPSPDQAPTSSRPRLGGAFVVGLASSVLGSLLTGLEGWEDFHLSVFAALATTLAATVFIARSSTEPVRYWPVALSGYLGILSPPILGYLLLALACAGAECCLGC